MFKDRLVIDELPVWPSAGWDQMMERGDDEIQASEIASRFNVELGQRDRGQSH